MNKPKLVSSPTIKKVKDRQFYKMIIKDAKRILPMVNESWYLCNLLIFDSSLRKVIERVVKVNHIRHRDYNTTFCKSLTTDYWLYRNTPAWKSDRIFLLEQIIKYCEYKLKQS